MQYMLSLESNPTQAIWWLTILIGFYSLLERLINRFCYSFANFDGQKKRQLWLNPCHYQLANKNDLLQASEGYYQCFGPSKGYYWHSSDISRPPRLNYQRPGVFFHLEILVIAMLFPRHQAETFYHLTPANGRPD